MAAAIEMTGLNMDDFKIGTMHNVNVTYINDPHSFYVRPIDIEPLLENLENQPFDRNPSADSVIYGMIVLYRSKFIGKFVRGKICYINTIRNTEFFYDIFAMDYGFLEKGIPLYDIGILDTTDSISSSAPLAIHCRLQQCEPIGNAFSEEVIDNFKFFMTSEPSGVIITIVGKFQHKLAVEVRTLEINDIATLMCLLDYTVLWKPNTVNRINVSSVNSIDLSALSLAVQSPQFKHKMLEPGVTFHARVQYGHSISKFYVAEINEYKGYVNRKPLFYLECKENQTPHNEIAPGLHCAVQLDQDTYERAIIKEILEPGETALVLLVDWGKEVKASFTSISTVHTVEYFDTPIVGIYCKANIDQVRENNLPEGLIPGNEFIVKIMELGYGFDIPHKVFMYPVS